jgi:hypothetical protein
VRQLVWASLIDSFHQGRATYVEIPGMSHHFDRQPNQADAMRALPSGKDGEFEPKVLTEIQDWLKHIT